MKFLLRLKHWQLFLIIWGIPLSFIFLPKVGGLRFPIVSLLDNFFISITFAWIWAIGSEFHKRLPSGVNLNIIPFHASLLFLGSYIVLLQLWIHSDLFTDGKALGADWGMRAIIAVIVLQITCVVVILMSIRFAVKSFKSVELGRLAKFPDYASEFAQACFSPIGMWALQPKLNKMTDPTIQ